MNLNKVFLIGRLTQDPESKTTPAGQTVCSFSIATNRVWNDKDTNQKKEQVEFHNIVLWRRLAEIAAQYLNKGSLVLIEGRIQTRSWQDQTGNKRYKTEVVADNIQMGPRNSYPSASGSQIPPSQGINSKQSPPAPREQLPTEEIPIIQEDTPPSASFSQEKGEDEEINVNDIPF